MTPTEKGAALAARRISRGAAIAPLLATAMPEDRKEARNRAQELRSAIKVGVTPQRRDALLCRPAVRGRQHLPAALRGAALGSRPRGRAALARPAGGIVRQRGDRGQRGASRVQP